MGFEIFHFNLPSLEAFHFDQPIWLWGLLVLPVIWIVFFLFYLPSHSSKRLESMIDSHLLPFLLINGKTGIAAKWKFRIFSWSLIWLFLMLALAGPRWSFRDIEMMSKDQSLIILLDLSESMDATDIKPSRLIRARQKIEDLIQHTQGVKIGLIAFAADPHMIAPLTDDKETLRHLLPSLGTELVYVQGSRLSPAFKMASNMLQTELSHHQTLVIISDGGFEDSSSAIDYVNKMAEKGIVVHAIGLGTIEGTILQDSQGNIIKKNGKAVLSKLEREPLKEISKAGQGYYIESGDDESVILNKLQSNTEAIKAGKTMRLWDEGFFYFLLLALPFFLFWFRRGMIMAIVLWAVAVPSFPLKAGIVQEYFMNSEEAGADAFVNGNYEEAFQAFQDPYRKGVACYKAGNFAEAEKMFRQSLRQEIARDAGYNLGNSLVQQKKYQEAITAYEDVLKKWPEHEPSKQNLEIVKKIIDQQKQDQKQDQQDQKDDQQDKNDQDQKDNQQQNKEQQNPKDTQEKNKEQDQKDDQQQNKTQQDNKENQEQNKNQQDQRENQEQSNEQQCQNESQKKNKDKQDQKNNRQKNNDEQNHKNDKQPNKDQLDQKDLQKLSEEEANENNDQKDQVIEAEESEEKSQRDLDADVWLNRLSDDPRNFMKNKFYFESKKNGTKEGIDPW